MSEQGKDAERLAPENDREAGRMERGPGMQRGGFITTYTGLRYHHACPSADAIAIADIAHALANLCHWGGHSRTFFSVAQHSVLVSLICPPELAKWGLLHDAAEAYYGDMSRPLKVLMPEYREQEKRGMELIARVFGLPWPEPPELKLYDNTVLEAEARALMAPGALHDGFGGGLNFAPIPELPTPLSPWLAEVEFLTRFEELFDPHFSRRSHGPRIPKSERPQSEASEPAPEAAHTDQGAC